MTRETLVQVLQKELEAVNERIDFKIVRGESYKRDAVRHKKLLVQLRRERRASRSFFPAFNFGFLSLF